LFSARAFWYEYENENEKERQKSLSPYFHLTLISVKNTQNNFCMLNVLRLLFFDLIFVECVHFTVLIVRNSSELEIYNSYFLPFSFSLFFKIKIFLSSDLHFSILFPFCRAKFVPDFLPTEEVATSHSTVASTATATTITTVHPGDVPHNEKFSPPTPEEAERIISNLLPQ
jgi:hypothetical protein